ncbi:restriction endonuclease [Streptomyces sp. NPDC127103]|uniref:restriction endonuclease n=1 Tax=Streptomyces sp. NPDC127103 TaxID=3347139 RepID=UPI00365AA242
MSGAYTVLHDPNGLIEAELPLDRAPHEALVTAVLAWNDPDLAPRDYEQIALQLTGHARAVASDVRRLAAALPKSNGRGALAEVVLREADGRLAVPLEGTARCVQNRARLVRALYTRLDRLTEPAPVTA